MKIILKIILFSLLLYFSQNILFTKSILSDAGLVIALGLSLYFYFLIIFLKTGKNEIKWLCLFISINIGYFVFSSIHMVNNLIFTSSIKTILIALSPAFPFFYAGLKGVNVRHIFLIFYLSFFALSILTYFNYTNTMLEKYSIETTIVNNISYNFVLSLPILMFIKRNKLFDLVFIVLSLLFVVFSAKRGALLCFIGFIIIYYFYLAKSIENIKYHKLLKAFFIFILIVVLITVLKDSYIIERLNNSIDNQSSREIIRYSLFNYWYSNINISSIIFGFGFDSTIYQIGNYSHSDWIEASFNYGLLGIGTYTILIISIINKGIKLKDDQLKYVIYSIIVIWILKSLSTGVYTGGNTFLLTTLLGYSLGKANFLKDNHN